MTSTDNNIHALETIDERNLHAYVDGLLEPRRARQFEAYLQRHPEMNAKVEAYRAQNRLLVDLFSSPDHESMPPRLLNVLHRRPQKRWPDAGKIAAVLVACIASAGAGWWGAVQSGPNNANADARLNTFLQPVQSPEHVTDWQTDPLQWLTQRVAPTIQAPDLNSKGYTIESQRLISQGSQAIVELTYHHATGDALQLHLQKRWTQDQLPTVIQRGHQSTAYWQDGPLVYALSGTFEPDRIAEFIDLIRASMNQGFAAPAAPQDFHITRPEWLESVQSTQLPLIDPTGMPKTTINPIDAESISAVGGS